MKNFYLIGSVAFVPHPVAAGFWFRTDLSVLKVACPYCKSAVGVPCFGMRAGKTGMRDYTSATHYYRRREAKKVELPRGSRITIHVERGRQR